jgi:multicomponent Na+:H+ antiporter subunit C
MNFFENILNYFNFYIFFILLFFSLGGIFLKKDFFGKLVALSVFQTNIILFFLSLSFNKNFRIPIINFCELKNEPSCQITDSLMFENPLPQVLMLTAIVVGLATFTLGLSILLKMNHSSNDK